MKYQKEFEEKLYGQPVLDEWPEVDPDTGKYYDIEAQMLYAGFVAGIESGVKKKEPTLLELVHEWRKSDISDEELLNNISSKLNKESYPFRPMDILPLFGVINIDVLYIDGHIDTNINSENVDLKIQEFKGWRPSTT